MNNTTNALFSLWPVHLYLLFALLFSSPSMASVPASPGVNSLYLLKMFLALVFVLGIFLVLAKVIRQMNGVASTSSGPLSIVASLSVGSRERILILKVGEEQLLVGVSPSGIVKLQDLDHPVAEEGKPLSGSFKNQLNQILGDRFN